MLLTVKLFLSIYNGLLILRVRRNVDLGQSQLLRKAYHESVIVHIMAHYHSGVCV